MKGQLQVFQVALTCKDAPFHIKAHLSGVHAAIAAAAVDGTLGRVYVFNLAELGQRAVVAALVELHKDGGGTAIILTDYASRSALAALEAIRANVAKEIDVPKKDIPLNPTKTGKGFRGWFSALKTVIKKAGGTLVLPELPSPEGESVPDEGAAASGGGSMH